MKRMILPVILSGLLLGGIFVVSQDDFVMAMLKPDRDDRAERMLWASGFIEVDQTNIVSEINGLVVDVLADKGDNVAANDFLIRLDTSVLEDQIVEIEAVVRAAEANYQEALKPVRQEEIKIAEARLERAQAGYDGALQSLQNALNVRDNPLELDAQIHEAQSQVQIAAKQVESAQAQLAQAEAGRDRYQFSASDQDKTQYQVYLKQVEAAQAAIAGAEANHQGMQRHLENLLNIRDNPLSLNAKVNAAKAQVNLSEQVVAVAEAELALLQAGPREEDIAIAKAQLELAQATLEELYVRRDKMTLRSPISGIITTRAVEPGEVAMPKRTLLKVADLSTVTLTVYIPEDQIGKVKLGQMADIYVDTFPDWSFSGVVSFIASEAEFTPKNIQTKNERVHMLFAVDIQIPNTDQLLKPGIPADATIYLDEIALPEMVSERTVQPAVTVAAEDSPMSRPVTRPSSAAEWVFRPDASLAGAESRPTSPAASQPNQVSEPGSVSAVTLERIENRPTALPSPQFKPTIDQVSLPAPALSGHIIFSTQDESGAYKLWSLEVDSLDQELIHNNLHQPDVRGDGLIIAKGEETGQMESLCALHVDGSGLEEASMYDNDVSPRWSPDGGRLAFVNEQVGELIIQEGLRKDARRLPVYFDITPILGRQPDWVDNEHIVYQGCDVWRRGTLCGLYITGLTGKIPPQRIVDDIEATSPAVHAGRIAYMSRTNGNWDIYLVEQNRTKPIQLTGSPAEDGAPAWSPDGKWLAFLSNRNGNWAVWVMSLEESRESLKLFDLNGSPGEAWENNRMAWIP